MFKLASKIMLLSLGLLTIGIVFSSGGKTFAASDCSAWAPANGTSGQPLDFWGVATGDIAHGMSGVRVHAHNDSNGNQLNVGYEMSSSLPPGDYHLPAGVTDRNARIFKWPLGQANGRDSDHWFRTGEDIYDGAGNSVACNGWSVLGPGDTTPCTSTTVISCTGNIKQWGNKWVLDCQEFDYTKQKEIDVTFRIASINTPSGQDGRYGGNWTVKITKRGSVIYNGSVPGNSFTVTNGETLTIDLIWHPNPPPTCPPSGCSGSDLGRCEKLYVNGWGAYDTGASLPNGSPRWRDTKTYVRVTDGNGNVIVPEAGEANDGGYAVLNGGPGPPGYNDSKTWYYKNKVKTKTITIQVIRKWHKRDGTDYFWYTDSGQNNTNTYTCYDASCDLSVQGNVAGHSNGVQSRSGFSVTAHVHNNGPPETDRLPATVDGRPLILASNPGSPVGFWYNPAAPNGIPKASPDEWNTWNPSDGIVEPGWSIGTYGIGAKLYYDFDPTPGIQSGDLVLADCAGASYDVYKQFHLDVSAEVKLLDNANNPTAEDPDKVVFNGYANGNVPDYPGGINVNYNASSLRTPYNTGVQQTVDNRVGATGHTNLVYSYNYNPPSNAAGDKYEINPFCVYQSDGWIGPGNQFSSDTVGSCDDDHQYVYDRPYLHAYGADVISGSNFKTGDTCDTTGSTQNISAFRSTDSSKGGSGTQFAALALGQISGFGSASTTSNGPTGLAFANTIGTTGGSADQPNDGGFYQGQPICAKDFYDTQKSPNTYTNASVNISTSGQIQDGKQTLYNRNGANLTITSNGTDFNKQAFIYVDGNVIINSNITFQPGKYLAIIAKGNIYIRRTVTRLDGLYVAQPRDSSNGGTIYTCALGTNDIALDSRYSQCRTQLVVNGAFAAKYVKFHRVANSLRDSTAKETPANFSDGSGTKAAEIFNLSPEIYLYTPIFEDVTTGGPAQYYTTLPPVL